MSDNYLDQLLAYGLTWFGKVQFQTKPPRVRAVHCRQASELAQPGMVICRRYDAYLDGHFIPGDYSHSGIVENHKVLIGEPCTVIHAVAEGVERIDLLDFIKDADGIALLQFEALDVDKTINFARSCIGKPYDFKFSIGDKGRSMYCHELSARSLDHGGHTIAPMLKMGREIYTYESLETYPAARLVYEAKVA